MTPPPTLRAAFRVGLFGALGALIARALHGAGGGMPELARFAAEVCLFSGMLWYLLQALLAWRSRAF